MKTPPPQLAPPWGDITTTIGAKRRDRADDAHDPHRLGVQARVSSFLHPLVWPLGMGDQDRRGLIPLVRPGGVVSSQIQTVRGLRATMCCQISYSQEVGRALACGGARRRPI